MEQPDQGCPFEGPPQCQPLPVELQRENETDEEQRDTGEQGHQRAPGWKPLRDDEEQPQQEAETGFDERTGPRLFSQPHLALERLEPRFVVEEVEERVHVQKLDVFRSVPGRQVEIVEGGGGVADDRGQYRQTEGGHITGAVGRVNPLETTGTTPRIAQNALERIEERTRFRPRPKAFPEVADRSIRLLQLQEDETASQMRRHQSGLELERPAKETLGLSVLPAVVVDPPEGGADQR